MFFIRQGHEISRTVIIFDSIKVMNYPTFRKWYSICLFPYNYVFQNTILIGSWVTRLINEYITFAIFTFTTFPIVVFRPFYSFFSLTRARVTSLSMVKNRYGFTTINAIFSFFMCFPIKFKTASASFSLWYTWLPTIYTRMFSIFHNLILAIYHLNVNYQDFHGGIICHALQNRKS